MAIVAQVKDGQLVETASQASLSQSTATNSNTLDKDAFLQLLVAQMKYQDPLEPTSNTEYVSQYAQFSQVESLNNMSAGMDLQRASSLVGQEVYIKTTTSTGETKYVQGKVDYVVYQNNKAFLSINESLYSIDDLDTVVDKDYLDAYNKALDWATAFAKLPNVNLITESDKAKVQELRESYDGMTDYEKSFIAKDYVTALEKLEAKLEELKKAE